MDNQTCPNLERDLCTSDWIVEKIKANDTYAQNVYAALCNNQFQRQELWTVLRDQRWSCSWRSAGAIVASIRGTGDHADFYCSGMAAWNLDKDSFLGYVAESIITDEVRKDLGRLGWMVCENDA